MHTGVVLLLVVVFFLILWKRGEVGGCDFSLPRGYISSA